MIPELKTAFCGCSLRTGTKIIGWLTLVLEILQLLGVSAIIAMFASMVSATSDEKFGEAAIKLVRDSKSPEFKDEEGMQTLHHILRLLVGSEDSNGVPEIVGRRLKGQLKLFLIGVYIFILAIILLQVLFTSMLLYGTYKNKSGYILFYIVLSILALLGFVPIMFSGNASWAFIIFCLIGCVIHLYFTWVIYSFYRELLTPSRDPNSVVMILQEQKRNVDGDVPIPCHAAPNDYYYSQK